MWSNRLQLLSKTLATIDDDKWVCQLAAEATRYLSTYNNALEEKVSAFNRLSSHKSRLSSLQAVALL